MPLSNTEFAAILADTSKCIPIEISWCEDEDHSPSVEFRAEVTNATGWPLFVRGSYNRLAGCLTYALILKSEGRIYGLDLGKEHHNPQCNQVGEKHKHRWTEQYRDKEAYVPDDITAPVSDPVAVWRQFCVESGILHPAVMHQPPPVQEDMFA
jgi:hypothetical protein